MKRNTVLLGASMAAGAVAAAGMIAVSSPSSAQVVAHGAAWSTFGETKTWTTGTAADSDGIFTATATAGAVNDFSLPSLDVSGIGVRVECTGGHIVTTVTGGPAAGTYRPGQSVSATAFTGSPDVVGTVTFGTRVVGGVTVGAFFDLTDSGLGDYIALAGMTGCGAAETTTSSTSTSTLTTTLVPTSEPSPTSTVEPTSTSGPTSTSTAPTTSSPTATAPPTSSEPAPSTSETEPGTPTPTTTSLPVAG